MHRFYYVAFLVQAAAENRQLQPQTPHIFLHHIRTVGEIVGRRGRAADICRGGEAEGDSQAEEGLRITGIAFSSGRFLTVLLKIVPARPPQQQQQLL